MNTKKQVSLLPAGDNKPKSDGFYRLSGVLSLSRVSLL